MRFVRMQIIFHTNLLLAGIHFLKDRMQRSIAREDDSINRVANTIWSTAITIADLISAYFNF